MWRASLWLMKIGMWFVKSAVSNPCDGLYIKAGATHERAFSLTSNAIVAQEILQGR